MPVVEESIVINKPRAEVFAFAADSANLLSWSSNIIEYEATPPGPVQADTTTKGVTRVAGRNVEWTARVTELEDGVMFGYQSVESPMAFTYAYRFEDAADGTRVTFHQDVPTIGGFFGKLADPIVTRMYARNVASNLANLKELLEA
jgi:uncharacterized membrane protein